MTAVVHTTRLGDIPPAIAESSEGVQPIRRLSVLFVGDSFTYGAWVQDKNDAYPQLIAKRENWDLHVDAQGATGFVANGQGTGNGDTSRLIDRLAADRQNFPHIDLLVVDAGRNDFKYPLDDIADALSEYLYQARKAWPEAQIVEIYPAFISSTQDESYLSFLNKVRTNLLPVDGTLLDPLGEGWYAHIDPGSLLADGVHPNRKGNAYIADRLIASLREKGVIPAIRDDYISTP